MATSIDPTAGKMFGKYEIVREIGRGGMGVVYEARETGTERTVALKVIAERLSKVPKALQRFAREAQVATRLNHPSFVPVYDLGRHEERDYIAMEFVRGQTLSDRIREKGKLDIEEATEIALQVADALAAVHRENIIHRDIKPQNIILDGKGRARVMDFGLAKLQDALTLLTKTGTKIGTPAYMPPEQVRGEDVDARSDVYSLGATLYEMLAGRPPFTGSAAWEILGRVLETPFPDVRQSRPEASKSLAAVLQRMTAKESAARYASAGEAAQALAATVKKPRARREGPAEKAVERLGESAGKAEETLEKMVAEKASLKPLQEEASVDDAHISSETKPSPPAAIPETPSRPPSQVSSPSDTAAPGERVPRIELWKKWLTTFSLDVRGLAVKSADRMVVLRRWEKQILTCSLAILVVAGLFAFWKMTMDSRFWIVGICLIYFRFVPKPRTATERIFIVVGGPAVISLLYWGILTFLHASPYGSPGAATLAETAVLTLAVVGVVLGARTIVLVPSAHLRSKVRSLLIFLALALGGCLLGWTLFDIVGHLKLSALFILIPYLSYLVYLRISLSKTLDIRRILLNLYIPACIWHLVLGGQALFSPHHISPWRPPPATKASAAAKKPLKGAMRYTLQASGALKDSKTGLEWHPGPNRDMAWGEAKQWTANLTIGGGGWRMPTCEELQDVYEPGVGLLNVDSVSGFIRPIVWSGEESRQSSAHWVFDNRRGIRVPSDTRGGRGQAIAVR